MNESMWKSTIREIKKSLGRYLAILAIVALGVGFFAGLHVMKAAMITTGDDYFKEHTLYDFRLISTLGFDEADLEVFQDIPELRYIAGAQEIDFIALGEDGVESVLKAHSITENINMPILIEGTMPINQGECVIDEELTSYEIGDTLIISENNKDDTLDIFQQNSYTVVGKVQSPLYINYERGNTSLGNGKIEGFVYFLPEEFDTDIYTQVYIKYNSDYTIYSQEYKNFIAAKEIQVEELCNTRKDIRYETVMREANNEIANGEKELIDAKEELDEARTELDDAAVKIQEGKDEIADKKIELANAMVEITNVENELVKGRQEIIDGEKNLTEGEAEHEKGEKELKDGRNKLAESTFQVQEGRLLYEKNLTIWNNGMEELTKSKELLDNSNKQLKDGWVQYNQGVQGLNTLKNMGLESVEGYQEALGIYQSLQGMSELNQEQKELLALLSQVIPQIESALGGASPDNATLSAIVTPIFTTIQTELDITKETLDSSQAEYDAGLLQYQEGKKTLEESKIQLDYALTQVKNAERELEVARNEIEDAQKVLDQGKEELLKGRKELENAKIQLSNGEKEIADAKREIRFGEEKLEDAEIELEDAEIEYLDGKNEYEEAKADADIEIAEAEEKIKEAKEDVKELKKPDYYVLGRDTNVGYVTFESNSSIVQGISNVFPLFFILIAALVCITTMNRMVEEQRTQIGILKALGYSEPVIMSKYMVYSGSAALIGCVLGFFAGSYFFPIIIWKAYGIMYSFVDSLNFIFNTPLLLLSIGVSLVCVLGTTYLSCHHELASVAAELIRPKAPKNGKRIFLERITFLWNRLNFLYKVSIRNVVRYKKRFFMMVIGISGCSALLVTGYGVKDSITNVAQKQYNEVFQYDLSVNLQEETNDTQKVDFAKEMQELLINYTYVSETSSDVDFGSNRMAVTLIVPEESNEIENFVSLYDDKGETIPYPKEGELVLSKSAVDKLRLNIGDTLTIWDSDGKIKMDLTLSGITENYVSNYAYIHSSSYESGFGKSPEYKSIYAKTKEGTDATQTVAYILNMDNIASATASSTIEERFGSMMSSMDYIILLIIVCAGALAFIVLYNLTNINITERIREIATIKVLGFYPMETAAYVFRENFVLAAIGAFVGLPLGFALHRFVMHNIVIDEITFVTQILPMSYVYSILLTFLFAIFVNILMFFKLQKVNMTESLKSIE